MVIDRLGGNKAIRAEVYRIFSECYKEPSLEFAGDVEGAVLYTELAQCFGCLGLSAGLEGLRLPGEPAVIFEKLKKEYYPLFVGPFPPFALPVESVYKGWAHEGTTPIVAPDARGMFMGEPAVDMLKRYQYYDIQVPVAFKDTPDHLALLLEYMGLLCEAESEAQGIFLRDHLDWVPEFRRLIDRCSDSGFYRCVAGATESFLAYEQRRLNEGGGDPAEPCKREKIASIQEMREPEE